MKYLFSFLLLSIAISNITIAQNIFSCQYSSQAQLKVYVTQYSSQADLIVYQCEYYKA